jgi:Skp family chaperone for outer membrane proteins
MKIIFFLLVFFVKINYSFADLKIAYIDINFILIHSLVGQKIEKHINKIEEEYVIKFKEQEKILKDKEKIIITQKNILDKKKIENKISLLNIEINNYRNERKKLTDELKIKKIEYTKKILNHLNPIITSFVDENSISIVLPKKNIIIGKKKLDITSDILNLLNNELKEIEF